MERREALIKTLKYGGCIAGSILINSTGSGAITQTQETDCETIREEKEFIQNWLSDLLNTMDEVLDDETKDKLMAGCGKGCYNRFKFKQDIAAYGHRDLDKLIEAYKGNFEIWRQDEKVHIRYGEISKGCYCPAAKYREPKPNDIHCECTRNTHKTIFETALERPVRIDIIETVRRGGKTCHFVVKV